MVAVGHSHKKESLKHTTQLANKFAETKRIYATRRIIYTGITFDFMPLPPFLEKQEHHKHQILWRNILKYEHSNPQRLRPNVLESRLQLAYEQALLPLYRHPEIWLEYALHLLSPSHQRDSSTPTKERFKNAHQTLDRAIKACPHTAFLRLA